MAHPNIILDQAPPTDCPIPAYNGVKYCFTSTDFITNIGTAAVFDIELQGANLPIIAPGGGFFIAGQTFSTGTENNYNTLDTSAAQTKAEFAVNVKDMLESNDYIFQRYSLEIVSDVVIATAREKKVQPDFTFDYTGFANLGHPLNHSETNGTLEQIRLNYRIIVQIWECIDEVATNQISQEAYQPDKEGSLCIDIGRKIAPLLSSRFLHDQATNQAWYSDGLIVKNYRVRYGELYSNTINTCGAQARTFEFTDCIRVYNAAFQRDEAFFKNDVACQPEFMTNTPDFTELCEDSIAYLWVNLFDIFQTPEPPGIRTQPFYEIFYTDGTSSKHDTTQFSLVPTEPNKIYAVAAGWKQISFLADPAKVVSYWRVRIMVGDSDPNNPANDYYCSQYFKLVSCCEGDVEFIFLNEYGGYDTILFNRVDAIAFQSSNAVFESFLDQQEEDSLRGGQDVIDQFSNEVFTVTGKFVGDYKSTNWLREFLNSPKKYIRASIDGQDKKINKVLVQVDGVQYANADNNNVYLRLQYRINEDLNHQEN